jgi:hypothetical protein
MNTAEKIKIYLKIYSRARVSLSMALDTRYTCTSRARDWIRIFGPECTCT